ncbi:DUF3237 domain-containing protein [Leifsonia shinshuensis]
MTVQPTVPALEAAFDVVVALGELADHGDTRAGHRRVIPIVGGAIDGGLEAEILPGGADWQVVRPDGAIEIDGRYTARTPEGEYVYLQVSGVRTADPGILDALLRGEPVPPEDYYFRTAIRFETASPRLKHLEHALYVASCVRDANAVRYRTYRVT